MKLIDMVNDTNCFEYIWKNSEKTSIKRRGTGFYKQRVVIKWVIYKLMIKFDLALIRGLGW